MLVLILNIVITMDLPEELGLAWTGVLVGPGSLVLTKSDAVTSTWIFVVSKAGTLGTFDLCSLLTTLGCVVDDINELAVDTVTCKTYKVMNWLLIR